MSPIADIVSKQERLEGDLRYAHMRIRAYKEQVHLGMELSSNYAAVPLGILAVTNLPYFKA